MSRTDAQLTETEVLQVQQLGDLPDSGANESIAKVNGMLVNRSSGGTAPVTSVFGRTGLVTAQNNDYTKAQVGLGNVDNTSDADKPVSIAQQTALDTKDFIRTMGQIASNLSFWTGTQAEFDALTPNATTFYIITT